MTARLPAYAPISEWCALSGMGRAKTYDLLSKGHLRAKKNGRRTLIDVHHGIRFIRSLPDVEIRLARAPREVGQSSLSSRPIGRHLTTFHRQRSDNRMALGPGKYDDLATLVMERAAAEGVIVMVFGGKLGAGFSVQASAAITLTLPELLRQVADHIERDMRL